MSDPFEILERHAAFGGAQLTARHASDAVGGLMTLGIFLPSPAPAGPLPWILYLSGLTCTHANVVEKGEYRRAAAAAGLAVVCPDTSPRGEGVPDDPAYDFGQGAGFYLDARREPWAGRFRMESYVLELLERLPAAFPLDRARCGISGHSMGGHGALTLALRHPDRFGSVSAFSPICAPSEAPWGRKAFAGYLGEDGDLWREHDAAALVRAGRRCPEPLVDVGGADPFLERELRPERLEAACRAAGQPLTLRLQPDYDHSYYFVSTFMAEHVTWHAARL